MLTRSFSKEDLKYYLRKKIIQRTCATGKALPALDWFLSELLQQFRTYEQSYVDRHFSGFIQIVREEERGFNEDC